MAHLLLDTLYKSNWYFLMLSVIVAENLKPCTTYRKKAFLDAEYELTTTKNVSI